MESDTQKMIAVGLVWGATNALMRRGALIWDQTLKSAPPPDPTHRRWFLSSLEKWLKLILTYQYSVPFFLNLSASAAFFAILGDAPISIAVPVTNATTFAATAVFGMALGEDTRVGLALFELLSLVARVEFLAFLTVDASHYYCALEHSDGICPLNRSVINHVVVPNPLHLTLLGITQLAVHSGRPPVRSSWGGTLSNADLPIPLTNPCHKFAESGYEGCTVPDSLNKATSCCPVLDIPYGGINP